MDSRGGVKMEMEIKEGKFYFMEDIDDQRLFDNLEDVVDRVKDLLKEDIEPDDVIVMEMSVSEDEIEARHIPWSKIAKKLA